MRRFVKQLPPLPYLLSPPHFFPPLRRCNVSDLLSGLETLSGILIDNDLSLEALPTLSLWEYVARTVARYGTVDFTSLLVPLEVPLVCDCPRIHVLAVGSYI